MLWVKGAEDPDFVWYRRIHPPHGGCVQPHAAADRHDPVWNVCITFLKNPADAEDAVQETFLRLLRSAPELGSETHEKAWLIRTTLHRACDMARAAERRNLPLETAEVLPGGEMPEPSPILSAVQALPAKYSAVIHLYYYEGYSIKEISKLLQIPLPTVGTRLSRGRERLRQLLKEDVE